MGGGSWSTTSYLSYSASKNRPILSDGSVSRTVFRGVQDVYHSFELHKDLNPFNVMRECRNTEEHPNTKPVILAIDVTGSMGDAAVEVARTLNPLMTQLYKELQDVEFCVMGIGDLAYDHAPIQMSQFESDIRIAEHLDKIYFEGGGGGNSFESYTAAWYMGLNHTILDAYDKQGRKGIIITLGDELINPYLKHITKFAGGNLQEDGINTWDLYPQVSKKFNLFHVHVDHDLLSRDRREGCKESFAEIIGACNVLSSDINSLQGALKDIILRSFNNDAREDNDEQTQITWETETPAVDEENQGNIGMPYISW